jgi:hypothetical protein
MKLIHSLVVLAMALLIGIPAELSAQEALDALVKKCETMKDVDINIIRKKNSKTGKLEPSVVTIDVTDNEKLCQAFLDAFEKDSNQATRTIENRKGGVVNTLFYSFEGVSYSYSPGKKKGCCTVTVLRRGFMSAAISTVTGTLGIESPELNQALSKLDEIDWSTVIPSINMDNAFIISSDSMVVKYK